MASFPDPRVRRLPAPARRQDRRAAPGPRRRHRLGGLAELAAARDEHRRSGPLPIEYRHVRGVERQSQIYVGGISGRRPRVPVEFAELERRAEGGDEREGVRLRRRRSGPRGDDAREPRGVPALADRPADAARRLRARHERRAVRPPHPVPVPARADRRARARAPRGRAGGRARPPSATGIPMVFSNQASTPMEEVAGLLGDSPRWFQLYWSVSDDLVESLVARAEACGCEAIVVTLDTTVLGWRTRDLELAYLPFLRGKGIAQYTSDPVFQRLLDEEPPRALPGARAAPGPGRARHAVPADPQLPGALQPRPRAQGGRALHPGVLAPVALLGRPAVPARAHEAADRAEGHRPPRRRAPRGRRRHGRARRLEPRRPPGGRLDRHARRAARRRRGGRRPDPRPARQRRARRRRRLQGARAGRDRRAARPARTSTGSRSPAAPASRRSCATSWPTST